VNKPLLDSYDYIDGIKEMFSNKKPEPTPISSEDEETCIIDKRLQFINSVDF